MRTTLTYSRQGDLFTKYGVNFKPFVKKYFKDYKFEGFEYGRKFPMISISNWNEVRDILPKSYKPIETK